MEMGASGWSTALLSLPRNGIVFVSPSSVAQSHHSGLLEFSLRTERRLVARKFYNPFRVSCTGESKPAMVTGKSWDKQVLKSEAPVLVEFYASWCGPCRMVHRVIEEISTEYSGRLNCFILDADKDLSVAENHDIKAVPVVLLFKNGMKRESIIGTMPKEFYVTAIERLLAS